MDWSLSLPHKTRILWGIVKNSPKYYTAFQVGSTEWVEENREMLSSKVVAYLNVDIAVSGAGFQASATPQLDQLIIEATKQVTNIHGDV